MKRIRAFIDEHHDQGVQMVQGQDKKIFEIDCQNEVGGLTIGINSHLMETIRLLRSRARTLTGVHRAEAREEDQTMMRFQAFQHCVIGVNRDGTAVLVEGPPKLYRVMGGPYLEESCQREGFDPMRGRPGLYLATIECRWDRGSLARVLAGEDPAVELTARDVKVEGFETLAIHRCDVVFGYAPACGSLRAQLIQVLRLFQTRVHQAC